MMPTTGGVYDPHRPEGPAISVGFESAERSFFDHHLQILCCPRCGADLAQENDELVCFGCRQHYEIVDGVPHLFWPNDDDGSASDVTKMIRSFYEEHPFPNYDGFDNVGTLIEKARKSIFAKLLDDQIPYGAPVLEVGCGTGQLTNFLSVANRTVCGTDLSLSSLALAQDFKRRNELNRAHFLQMNLFRPCFKAETFDLVISNGVLHHTANPFLAFTTIARLAKTGRYVIVGLYHRYGRIATDVRRFLFRISKDRLKFLDRRSVSSRIGEAKRDAWFMDQYKNPHESKHTVGEVLGWLNHAGLEFVKCIPKTSLFSPLSPNEHLFEQEKPGNRIERAFIELSQVIAGSREGGFFIVIAKKRGRADVAPSVETPA